MSNTILYGRVVRDIECRYSPNQKAYAKFSIAVNRKFPTDDKKSDFFNIIAFSKKAETLSQYFRQGSRIVVYCHPQQEEYTNKDGQRVNTVSFILDDFDFVDTRAEGGIAQNQSTQKIPSISNADKDGFMSIPDGIDGGLPFE